MNETGKRFSQFPVDAVKGCTVRTVLITSRFRQAIEAVPQRTAHLGKTAWAPHAVTQRGRDDFVAQRHWFLSDERARPKRPKVFPQSAVVTVVAGHSRDRELVSRRLMRIKEKIAFAHFGEETETLPRGLLVFVEAMSLLQIPRRADPGCPDWTTRCAHAPPRAGTPSTGKPSCSVLTTNALSIRHAPLPVHENVWTREITLSTGRPVSRPVRKKPV